jgi:hypothetical protein
MGSTLARLQMCSDANMNSVLSGTAPHASRWWLIEDPGPWDSHAVKNHSSPHVTEIRDRCPHDERIILVRPRESRTKSANHARVWRFTPGSHLVHVTTLQSFSRFTQDEDIPWQSSDDYPNVVVCTNGKRDTCCAIKGNGLLRTVPDRSRVWECSHLGGHRFAPSVLFIPCGYVAGRVTKADIIALSDPSPVLPMDKLRGQSLFSAPQQVADIVVRQHAKWEDPTLHTVVKEIDAANHAGHTFLVVGANDEAFVITLEQRHSDPIRESCISDPTITSYWVPTTAPRPAAAQLS